MVHSKITLLALANNHTCCKKPINYNIQHLLSMSSYENLLEDCLMGLEFISFLCESNHHKPSYQQADNQNNDNNEIERDGRGELKKGRE